MSTVTQLPSISRRVNPAFDVAYAVAAVAAIFLETTMGFTTVFNYAVKGLPLAMLTFMAVRGAAPGLLRTGIAVGFFFSMIGDVVIVIEFLAGIGAFFVAHIAYVAALGGVGRRREWTGLVPAAAVWGGMYALLADKIPADLYVPVIAYMTVISVMYLRAAGRWVAAPGDTGRLWMVVGASLFVLSDACIAINRWVSPIPYGRIVILGTYFAGQWMIFRSLLAARR